MVPNVCDITVQHSTKWTPKSFCNNMAVTPLWLWVSQPSSHRLSERQTWAIFWVKCFSLCPAPSFIIMVRGTAPLNRWLWEGGWDQPSLYSKANAHGSPDLTRPHWSALPHVTVPHGPRHLSSSVTPVNSVRALIRTQGLSSLVLRHRAVIPKGKQFRWGFEIRDR